MMRPIFLYQCIPRNKYDLPFTCNCLDFSFLTFCLYNNILKKIDNLFVFFILLPNVKTIRKKSLKLKGLVTYSSQDPKTSLDAVARKIICSHMFHSKLL